MARRLALLALLAAAVWASASARSLRSDLVQIDFYMEALW
jgi:hypothetical protein